MGSRQIGIVSLALALTLVGCQNSGRYSQHKDSAPHRVKQNISMQDAEPQFEPYRDANSRPYTVLGKHYIPMTSGKGHTEEGKASWYGQKFHGHLTSNGERYDMYAMSAAHKTLPLPSYVQVTNQNNGRKAIVRVNDRGPFHPGRIIDLSYAAAMKLGVLDTGTADVRIEVIHVDEDNMVRIGKSAPVTLAQFKRGDLTPMTDVEKALFIQVIAVQDEGKAQRLADGLASLYQIPAVTPTDGRVYRLRLGPIADESHAQSVLSELHRAGYDNAFTLYAAP